MDGLYQVIGNLGADGLVHDVLLLTFGDHHDGDVGVNLLDMLKCLQSAHTYHMLVQKHQVILAGAAHVKRIVAVGHGVNLIAFVLKEKYMRPEQVNLIINPKQCSVFILHLRLFLIRLHRPYHHHRNTPQTESLRQCQIQECSGNAPRRTPDSH